MGLWSFVKRKGKTLFEGGETAELNSDVLRAEVADLGLDASGLEISVDADADLQTAGIQAKIDRKSTRLNSSHQIISYAVFCLKKKKTRTTN